MSCLGSRTPPNLAVGHSRALHSSRPMALPAWHLRIHEGTRGREVPRTGRREEGCGLQRWGGGPELHVLRAEPRFMRCLDVAAAKQREVQHEDEMAKLAEEARRTCAAEVACFRAMVSEVGEMDRAADALQREHRDALKAAKAASQTGNQALAKVHAAHEARMRHMQNALERKHLKQLAAARMREENLVNEVEVSASPRAQGLHEPSPPRPHPPCASFPSSYAPF